MVDPKLIGELDAALELMYFGFRRLVEEPDRVLVRRSLSRVHHRILYFVARRPGLTVGELLAALDVTKQAVHRPLQQLTEQRLVVSGSDPRDRRIRRLTLSRTGTELETRLSGIQHARLQRVFEAAGPLAERGWRRVMGLMGAA